jgi:hypothetical protein
MEQSTKKRAFSPTINDIRQFNIKRQRVLENFDSLDLTDSQTIPPCEHKKPISTQYKEYIPSIDEFLLLNQDDRDVLESSRHIEFYTDDELIIPDLTMIPMTREQFMKSVMGVRNGSSGKELVKYRDPWVVVYERWLLWVRCVGVNNTISMNTNDDDLMIDDVYAPGADGVGMNFTNGVVSGALVNRMSTMSRINKWNNAYGGYYENNPNDDSDEVMLD